MRDVRPTARESRCSAKGRTTRSFESATTRVRRFEGEMAFSSMSSSTLSYNRSITSIWSERILATIDHVSRLDDSLSSRGVCPCCHSGGTASSLSCDSVDSRAMAPE
jgi:hypothetical protein